jgi:hypothetical protein
MVMDVNPYYFHGSLMMLVGYETSEDWPRGNPLRCILSSSPSSPGLGITNSDFEAT